MTTTIHSTGSADKAWAPDVIGVPIDQGVPDVLIRIASTVSGRVEGDEPSLRVAYVDDDAAAVIDEGDEIPEADPQLSEVTVVTHKVGQLARVSYELWTQTTTAGLLSKSLQRAVTKAADDLLVNGNPSSPSVPGLAAAAGHDVGEVADDLDALVEAVAHIEADGGQASVILVAPDTWAALRKLKTAAGSNASLIGAGTDDADRRLLSLPVRTSSALASGTGIVLDSSAVVSAVGDVRVATSEDIYFASDSIGVRATLRCGSSIVKDQRVVTFDVNGS